MMKLSNDNKRKPFLMSNKRVVTSEEVAIARKNPLHESDSWYVTF